VKLETLAEVNAERAARRPVIVVTEALDVIASCAPKMLEFGVAEETAWNVGLSCGGTIRVFVEKVG
jgi:xanthine/CO dehydrogenase XdhC/CoxF family maturation factor